MGSWRFLSAFSLLFAACATEQAGIPEPPSGTGGKTPPRTDTSGLCSGICNASPASLPVITDSLSHGDVTTYGSVVDPAPSQGGACNYGATRVYSFAAIQVHQAPGDLQGQWQEGRACGQCVEVSLRSSAGWKTTVVRIMDKCPDANCGVDLGGAPAKALMGDAPGRYSGKWRFVACDGHPDVSDGPASLFVKEGSNAFWSLVQARNAAGRISGMRLRKADSAASREWQNLPWATEAENFFKVPTAILQDSSAYEMQVALPSGIRYALDLKGSDLGVEKASWVLKEL